MDNYKNYNFADIIKFILNHKISKKYKQKKTTTLPKTSLG